jgi:transcriptional regulator with XRE-family HTH domain
MKGMKERLRTIRKALKLTQGEFGQKLGVSDVAISYMESGRTKISDQNVNLICLTFGVNETWLRTGEGTMFDRKYNNKEKQLLEIYRELGPELQDYIYRATEKAYDLQKGTERLSADDNNTGPPPEAGEDK